MSAEAQQIMFKLTKSFKRSSKIYYNNAYIISMYS